VADAHPVGTDGGLHYAAAGARVHKHAAADRHAPPDSDGDAHAHFHGHRDIHTDAHSDGDAYHDADA